MCVMFLVSRFFDECFNHTCNNGGSSVDGVNNYRCKWKPDSCLFLQLLFLVSFYFVQLVCLVFSLNQVYFSLLFKVEVRHNFTRNSVNFKFCYKMF